MKQRSDVAALMPAAAFRDSNEYFLPLVLCPYLLVSSWQHLVSCGVRSKKYDSARQGQVNLPKKKYGCPVGSFDEGSMAEIGREVSGDW